MLKIGWVGYNLSPFSNVQSPNFEQPVINYLDANVVQRIPLSAIISTTMSQLSMVNLCCLAAHLKKEVEGLRHKKEEKGQETAQLAQELRHKKEKNR